MTGVLLEQEVAPKEQSPYSVIKAEFLEFCGIDPEQYRQRLIDGVGDWAVARSFDGRQARRPYSPGRVVIDQAGIESPETDTPLEEFWLTVQTQPGSEQIAPERVKTETKKFKSILVELLNSYATERFTNGQKVFNGRHMGGNSTIETFTAKSLMHWREKMVLARRQSVNSSLYEAWEPEDKKL
ncbi:MAG: hypothetical protein M3P98_04555, partial [bacterium]|nr:hypothetical protein [bacterium]